jgi:hypothetical protein
MYTFFKKIEGVKRAVADQRNIFYIVTKDNSIKFLDHEKEILKIDTNISYLVVKENLLFVESFSEIDGLEKTDVYNLAQSQFEKFPFAERILLRGEVVNNKILSFYNEERLKKEIGVVAFDSDGKIGFEKLDTDFKKVQYKLSGNTIVLSDKNRNIYMYSGNQFEKRTSFSLSNVPAYKDVDGNLQNAELVSVIGIYKGLLWLHIKQFYFIALGVESGELKHQVFLPEVFNIPATGPWYSSFTIGDVHLDSEKGIIKSLAFFRYWEFDLNTLQGVVKKEFGVSTKEKPLAWRINKSQYYPGDKNLYFIGTRPQQSVNDAIGVFDTEICEVAWFDEPLPKEKYLFFSILPQVNSKFLIVQDSQNGLWVYQKEQC